MKNKKEYKRTALKIRRKYADSPHLEIDKIYDLGIKACDAKDALKVLVVIDTLKRLPNIQYKEVAAGFCRLYDYCLQFVNNEKFDSARDILYELHQSWNVAVITNLNNTN